MRNVLVTGSNGQLGSELRELAGQMKDYQFLFTDIDELDLTAESKVDGFFKKNNIQACINCAAYTAVDKAEDEQGLTLLVNHQAVKSLAKICRAYDALLIHVSTDYVFDGTNHKPYQEDDTPNPNSFYGLSKLKGEDAVLAHASKVAVVRTSWLYSSYGNNFVKTMLRLGEERESLGVVADQVGTPTYAADLAAALLKILEKRIDASKKEIFHYSNEGAISWYDFAKAIMDLGSVDCEVNAIESKDFPAKANRPFYSVLNKSRIKNEIGISVPYWMDSLEVMIKKLQS